MNVSCFPATALYKNISWTRLLSSLINHAFRNSDTLYRIDYRAPKYRYLDLASANYGTGYKLIYGEYVGV